MDDKRTIMEILDEIVELTGKFESDLKEMGFKLKDTKYSEEQDLIDLQKAEQRDGNFKN